MKDGVYRSKDDGISVLHGQNGSQTKRAVLVDSRKTCPHTSGQLGTYLNTVKGMSVVLLCVFVQTKM